MYECYLNLNFKERESEELKRYLDKIKGAFKEIVIEEISLSENV